MDQKIQNILNDLYQLDPSLQQDEAKLIKIINALIAAKPQVAIDDRFVQSLRRHLLVEQAKPETKLNMNLQTIKQSFMKKITMGLGVVAVCAVLVVGAAVILENQISPQNLADNNQGVKITATSDYAFGELNRVDGANNSDSVGNNPASESDRAALSTSEAYGSGGAGPVGLTILPPDQFPTYQFVYIGDELLLTESQRQVLKRQRGEAVAGNFGSLLNSLSFGLADIGSFPNLRLQSASFAQPGQDGYNIYVNADDSSINISGAWPVFAQTSDTRLCIEVDCGAPPPIDIDQIPADEELLNIANAFVSTHGIPTTAYGQPEVQDEWRVYYALAQDKSTVYVPDTINVVYPLLIDGQFVYEEQGTNKVGLQIGINVRNNKVVNVWDLKTHSYQSSMYAAETDAQRILDLAEQGGIYGYQPFEESTNVIEVELGTPTVEFVRMWNYRENANEELLIPALVFPVLTSDPTAPYLQRTVSVPLIQEILDNNSRFPIDILPLGSGDDSVSSPLSEPVFRDLAE